MLSLFSDLFQVLKTHKKQLGILLLIVVTISIMGGLILKYETTQSEFCDSCHYMAPYVRHWEASSHADVDCRQCHDYGVTDLIGSAIKYGTNSYNNRPKAIVNDESCLASGCHENQNLEGAIEYKNNVFFDHSKHLEKALRGEKLRCTSCHNQIVQYDDDSQGHMSVNDKSCFICHFKDAGVGEAITGCNSCHGMPEKEVEHAGFMFNHKPYLELNVECKQCHTNIVKGDGAVPESRCHSCHVERSRTDLGREQVHNIHITENGIDCYKCHTDIEHGNFSMVSALEVECESCHLRQHNQPKQLYMGIGGKDNIDMPSEMFTAQVSCTGCHTHISPEGEILARQEKKEAAKNSCVTCHGEDYDLMFDNWISGSKKVLGDYKKFISAAKTDLRSIGGNKKSRRDAQSALSKAEYHYNFTKEGHFAHNIKYASFLLNYSADEFEVAMKKIKKSYKAPNRGNGLKPDNSCETFCHGNAFRPETVMHEGEELPHLLHIEDMEVSCSSCHSTSEHGKTNIQQDVCSECH